MRPNFDSPITLYRGSETRVVMNQKSWDQAKAEGFGAYNAAQNQYPKAMYDRVKPWILVRSIEEENRKLQDGWSTKPFPETETEIGEEVAMSADASKEPVRKKR